MEAEMWAWRRAWESKMEMEMGGAWARRWGMGILEIVDLRMIFWSLRTVSMGDPCAVDG